jgi:hypothetical protein
LIDYDNSVIRRIDRKVKEWASWNRLKSFLQQNEIKDGIDRLHRDIDAAMMKFNVLAFVASLWQYVLIQL